MSGRILDVDDGISRRGALFGLGAVVGLGQGMGNGAANRLIHPGQAPALTREYLAALGDRVTKRGRERANAQGRLAIGTNAAEAVTWTWEHPGKLRLTRPGGRGTIVFDPDKPHPGNLDETSEGLLESLSADTAESFFDGLQSQAALRPLGERFAVSGKAGFGALVDVFEYGGEIRARNRRGRAVKHFMFDSQVRLLSLVSYSRVVNGRPTGVSTELSNYQTADGYSAPRRIVRRHGNSVVFQLDVDGIQWTAAAADGLFG